MNYASPEPPGVARAERIRLRKARKLLKLLRTPAFRRALRWGVAATIEHDQVAFGHEFATVIDVGAHQGQFSLFAAERFPTARLWALEPLAEPRMRLERVLAGRHGLTVVPSAAAREPGPRTFHVSRASDASSLLETAPSNTVAFPGTEEVTTREIQAAPLDSLLDPDELARPCLIKIDVQGAELEVLAGARRTLENVDEMLVECSFVELYRGQALAAQVIADVCSRGFHLSGVYGVVHDIRGRCLQADLLFSRPAEARGPVEGLSK